MSLHLFDLFDHVLGSVRCRECGAVDMVTTDTWTDVNRTGGLVICGSCGGAEDIASFPLDWRDI